MVDMVYECIIWKRIQEGDRDEDNKGRFKTMYNYDDVYQYTEH